MAPTCEAALSNTEAGPSESRAAEATFTHSLYLSHTHTHTFSFSLSLTHSLAHTQTLDTMNGSKGAERGENGSNV